MSEQPICDIVDPCAVNSDGNCTEIDRQAVCDCEQDCKNDSSVRLKLEDFIQSGYI